MGWFRSTTPAEPLALTMTGVKLGDRVVAVGMRDRALIAALAVKAGLTGRTCAVDADPDRVRAGTAAIEREGALVETAHAPWRALPFETASFDVAVARDVLMALPPGERSGCLAEILRLLRPGGRIIVIEPLPRRGLAALVGRVPVDADYESDGGAVPALIAAGFSAARVLADRKGTRFVEAAKRQSTAD